MKKLAITFILGSTSLFSYSQNFIDALRYSRTENLGTARYTAMGGSFGALGGEVSGFTINPAGVGVYRNSEFTFSTGFNLYDSESTYRGEKRNDGRLNFNIPNIAYVGTYKGDPNGWKNYSFGINYNRNSSFNREGRIVGNSVEESIINDYVNTLNGDFANIQDVEAFAYPFGPSEAWNTLMIDSMIDGNGRVIYQPFVFDQDNTEHIKEYRTRGSQTETSFSFGGNYRDRLFLGASIGFHWVRYDQEVTYTENYSFNGNIDESQYYGKQYTEEYSLLTVGTGINFKFGAIYKVNEMLRLGGAIHSPTFFGFSEEFSFTSRSQFVNGEAFDAGESYSEYDYRLRTPTRFIGSVGLVFSNKAAVNADYEYVDYTGARLNDNRDYPYDFSEANNQIDNVLNASHNVRFGGEYKEGPFAVRAGFRYESNPYGSRVSFKPDEARKTYSLGGGFRSKNYNIDVAYSFFNTPTTEQLFTTAGAAAKIDEREHNLILTVGWKW
jgi:hypothetical protein